MLRPYVPVVRRRIGVVALGLMMGVFSAGAVHAQEPAPSGPYVFTSDSVVMLHIVKPEATTDYEATMGKVKEALAKSEKPERKQQAANWKLYKAAEAGPNGAVLYLWVVSPAVKGADYNPFAIIGEAFPADAGPMYEKLKDGFVAQNKFSLTLLSDMNAQ